MTTATAERGIWRRRGVCAPQSLRTSVAIGQKRRRPFAREVALACTRQRGRSDVHD
jgi:hypothetical protein